MPWKISLASHLSTIVVFENSYWILSPGTLELWNSGTLTRLTKLTGHFGVRRRCFNTNSGAQKRDVGLEDSTSLPLSNYTGFPEFLSDFKLCDSRAPEPDEINQVNQEFQSSPYYHPGARKREVSSKYFTGFPPLSYTGFREFLLDSGLQNEEAQNSREANQVNEINQVNGIFWRPPYYHSEAQKRKVSSKDSTSLPPSNYHGFRGFSSDFGLQNSRTPELQNSRTPELQDSRTPGLQNSRTPELRIPNFP